MQTVDLLVQNARIVQPATNSVTPPDTAFAVRGGVIVEMGPGDTLAQKYHPQKVLDAADKYVVPGFVNTHNHLFQVLTKGLGKERLLWDWLTSTIMCMTPHIDDEATYWAALAGCLASIRTGVTTTLDFNHLHSHPGQFDAVCRAFTDSGMRGYVGRHQYMNPYKGLALTQPESCSEYRKTMRAIVGGMKDRSMLDAAIVVPIIIGMMELPCYHEDYLGGLRRLAEELEIPYTAHVVETPSDDDYCMKETGHSTIHFMEEQGFLGERCVLAHCVHMDDSDYEIFRRNRVKVSYNPVSNMILASGVAPIGRFLDAGVTVSIGTDGSGSNDSQDMLESLKMASLLQKVVTGDSRELPAPKVLEMATLGGARTLCRDDIGEVAAGKKADFFLYNPSALRSAPVADVMASLVYTSGETSVDTVVINGRVVLEGGQFTGIDERAVVENLEKAAARVREKSGVSN